jgi:hypothetical protein
MKVSLNFNQEYTKEEKSNKRTAQSEITIVLPTAEAHMLYNFLQNKDIEKLLLKDSIESAIVGILKDLLGDAIKMQK